MPTLCYSLFSDSWSLSRPLGRIPDPDWDVYASQHLFALGAYLIRKKICVNKACNLSFIHQFYDPPCYCRIPLRTGLRLARRYPAGELWRSHRRARTSMSRVCTVFIPQSSARLAVTDLRRPRGHGDGAAEAEFLVGDQRRMAGLARRNQALAAVRVQIAERSLRQAKLEGHCRHNKKNLEGIYCKF